MYQVIARRFRPQQFRELLGHEAIVQILKNTIKLKRYHQAYLFSGPRGTGKTTIARLFAKAVNCDNLDSDFEPCSLCSSCAEIKAGQSLDVIEIDGASNRGIDDVRKIIETIAIQASGGHYKIYIIDEVHMLTKEAFNALLKTLEEPPAKVIFIFATTEPHKVLPTILSRCQRFSLCRIPLSTITQKLKNIVKTLDVTADDEALQIIAKQAEGGLRDAESLLDQVIGFEEGAITADKVSRILGLASIDSLFQLNQIIQNNQLTEAAKLAHNLYLSGRDLTHYLDHLIDHFRTLLLVKLKAAEPLALPASLFERYTVEQALFSEESLIAFIEHTLKMAADARQEPINVVKLESLFYKLIRLNRSQPLANLIERLEALEKSGGKIAPAPTPKASLPQPAAPLPHPTAPLPQPAVKPEPPKSAALTPPPEPQKSAPVLQPQAPHPSDVKPPVTSISIDPTPKESDIRGLKPKAAIAPAPKPKPVEAKPVDDTNYPPANISAAKLDTMIHFAAIELEGRITKKG